MNLTKAAKDFLLVYFSDGQPHTPADFENDIIGGLDLCFLSGIPRWNKTPFFDAMGELVEEGKILFKLTRDGQYYYHLPNDEFEEAEIVAPKQIGN